jgi:hypothetical protein
VIAAVITCRESMISSEGTPGLVLRSVIVSCASMSTANPKFSRSMDHMDPLIAGRDFLTDQDNLPGDNKPWKIIVNEASLKALGIAVDEAPGTSVFFEPGPGVRYEYNIIGVVKDFHQFSLHRKPLRLILFLERVF